MEATFKQSPAELKMAERGDRVEHREENYRLSWLKGVLKLGVHIIYHLLRDTSGKEKSTINNDTRTAFVTGTTMGKLQCRATLLKVTPLELLILSSPPYPS